MVVLGFYAQGEAKILTIELGQTAFGETAFWGLLGLLGSVVSQPSDIIIFLVSHQTNYCVWGAMANALSLFSCCTEK